RALGGWPGVLGESHLSAAADLLDDPVPMLEPLSRLPQTILHGDMHHYHWHVTLFEQRRLLDWSNVTLGPAVYDLITFQERFDLLETGDSLRPVYARSDSPIDEETMIDSYLLAMNAELGSHFDARAMRLAIPAARCLHVLVNWFPYFAGWFDQMPDVYTWQRVNRAASDESSSMAIRPMLVYRPYLKRVFRHFLQAYRML
ncbi:MAG: phosphotransferase, partial [Candidatus Promineifilaceae bacterium]